MCDKYKQKIKKGIQDDLDFVFTNSTPDHAKYIITEFVKSAEKEILILSGTLCDAFYSEHEIYELLRDAAKRIKRSGGIKIITAEPGEFSQKIKDLAQKINTEVAEDVVKYMPGICESKDLKHFILIDEKRYRIEKPHAKIDPTSMPKQTSASVNCNSPRIVAWWKRYFNSIWNSLSMESV